METAGFFYNIKECATSLKDVLDREVSLQEAIEVFSQGFTKALNIELEPGELTQAELESAYQIAKERYSNFAWNNKR